jgi:hypothetical protein
LKTFLKGPIKSPHGKFDTHKKILHRVEGNVWGETFCQLVMGCQLGKPFSQKGKCLGCHLLEVTWNVSILSMILDILTNIAPLGWVTQYANQYYLEVLHLTLFLRHYCVKGLLENSCPNREFEKKKMALK